MSGITQGRDGDHEGYRCYLGRSGSNQMAQQAIAQLRLEPRRLWWHYLVRVRDGHQLFDRHWMQRKRNRGVAFINQLLECCRAANAAHKIYPFVGSNVGDAQKRVEHSLLK